MQDYFTYEVESLGYKDDFYYVAESYSPKYRQQFDDLILNILKVESPMHTKQLALRLIEHYDMRTVGAKISTSIA